MGPLAATASAALGVLSRLGLLYARPQALFEDLKISSGLSTLSHTNP